MVIKLNFSNLTKNNFSEFKTVLDGRYENSEASVASMYTWQHYYNTRFCLDNDILYSIYDMHGKQAWTAFMPYGKRRNSCDVTDKLKEYFEKELKTNLVINLATQDYLDFLINSGKYIFKYKPIPNSFDYVYNVNELIELSGRKFHSKKNNFNSFVNTHNFEYIRYNASMYEECISFCSDVIRARTKEDTKMYESEMKSIYETFDALQELNLICSLITVDGKIVALSVGERLTDNYALIHIEKASYDFRDAYPVINRLTLENEFSDMEFVNREEDLGIEGLRKAKESYNPCKMIKKYRIEFL